ncbi:MAG: alcohol dehydrogenase catalytic domain-containing protein, partial [Candidatus Nanoarchaeia archaeon]
MNDKTLNDIPKKMLAWPLFGTGMDKLGKDDKPCEIPVPEIKDDELLVRIDAIGLCFSDVKLIKAGEKHPRVISKDLSTDPVIPGHEAVMTVVKVGKKYSDRFKAGERYIIQADVYYQGKGLAYGYAINGGFAQYSVIDKRVIEGDECCYLLPLADSIPSAVAAMIEPWTCVIASYRIEKRKTPLKGGKMLIAGLPSDSEKYSAGKLLETNPPSEIYLLDIPEQAVSQILEKLSNSKVIRLQSVQEAATKEYDDIFLCNMGSEKEKAEKIATLGSKNALISFVGKYKSEMWSFDVGAIHYKGWLYQGADSTNLSDSYGSNIRSQLKSGGACWLVGGAGAMGQMHTQLAVEMANGPSRILVSDMDDMRIENVKKLLSETVRKKGIVFETLNPKHFSSPTEFTEKVAKFAEKTGGFD